MDELVSPANAPFLVAICLMAALGVLEGLSLLIGGGLSHHLDAFLAAHHFDGPNVGEGFLGCCTSAARRSSSCWSFS